MPGIVQSGHGLTLGDEMGHNDHIDFELHERIQHFTDTGELEPGTKEHGIALFVADNGLSALSPAQRTVWDKGIAPIIYQPMNDEERLEQIRREDWEEQSKDPDAFG